MNTLKPEKRLAVISCLVEGNSIRSTERMTGVHRDTILRLLVQVGERCQAIMDERMQGFHCRLIQADEIWTFCRKKEQRLSEAEEANPELGDQYVFVALDPESKLIPTFLVGKRDTATAHRFTHALRACLNGNGRIQLTTDGLRAYLTAVEEAFGADVDYAQLVKMYGSEPAGDGRYAPPRVTEVVSTVINGNPDPARICTSHVERQNLTIRMMCRRFTRLTNAFSKKLANLKAALALHFAYYNFCRIHQTLRVTPAMAARITGRVWGLLVGIAALALASLTFLLAAASVWLYIWGRPWLEDLVQRTVKHETEKLKTDLRGNIIGFVGYIFGRLSSIHADFTDLTHDAIRFAHHAYEILPDGSRPKMSAMNNLAFAYSIRGYKTDAPAAIRFAKLLLEDYATSLEVEWLTTYGSIVATYYKEFDNPRQALLQAEDMMVELQVRTDVAPEHKQNAARHLTKIRAALAQPI